MSDSLREHLLIASKFLRNPRTVGAVSASSKAMALEMVREIPTDKPVNVVELGPGTGSFTRAIVERIAPGSRFLAIELDGEFVERLRPRWPSVEFALASAVELEQLVKKRHLQPVDHIVSGLPFASLPVDDSRKIMDGIQHTLRPGGTFTTFQYLHGYWMPPGRTFRREMSVRMGAPHRQLVLKNFPISFILTWTRPAAS
jgi:phosphatidylethanolamine/phosphatidyl-N-methylethanolamine N-methyltransferase